MKIKPSMMKLIMKKKKINYTYNNKFKKQTMLILITKTKKIKKTKIVYIFKSKMRKIKIYQKINL